MKRAAAVEQVALHAQLSREKDLPKPDVARIARLEKAVAEAADKRRRSRQGCSSDVPICESGAG